MLNTRFPQDGVRVRVRVRVRVGVRVGVRDGDKTSKKCSNWKEGEPEWYRVGRRKTTITAATKGFFQQQQKTTDRQRTVNSDSSPAYIISGNS